MTIRVNAWYRVKATRQYCVVQKIPSTTNPSVSISTANENTRGFELALTWYAPAEKVPAKWTKRAMIMEIRKALGILRELNEDDRPVIDEIKSISAQLPVSSASRDGEFTMGGTE